MSKLNVPIWTGVKIGVNVRVSKPPKSPSFLPIFRNSAAKSRTDQNSGTALPEQHNPLTHTKKATVADDLRGAENGTRTRDLNLGKECCSKTLKDSVFQGYATELFPQG